MFGVKTSLPGRAMAGKPSPELFSPDNGKKGYHHQDSFAREKGRAVFQDWLDGIQRLFPWKGVIQQLASERLERSGDMKTRIGIRGLRRIERGRRNGLDCGRYMRGGGVRGGGVEGEQKKKRDM